jgi:cysteinyl-tRNA synthetase
MKMRLNNTRHRAVGVFEPHNPNHIQMYVCGPTVYARPHIGNARSAVIYDQLYRVLKAIFPRVTYARNITDVDDKINAAATARGISIQALTQEVTTQFHEDMGALSCLSPDIEPKATEHIAQIITMIETLIASKNAYVADGHVLFSVSSDAQYGTLARRSLDDMIAGARVEIAPYKKDPADFVLWKPAAKSDDTSSRFASPWGEGRPGWHIECSAMATAHLGESFDIHGGGADLMFPHHENECAQSRCANPKGSYAKYWVHNGFLTVNGEKMSKSVGNFITVYDLLAQGVKGEAIRLALLSARYNEPLDWTQKLLSDAQKTLDKLYRLLDKAGDVAAAEKAPDMIIEALADNLNTPKAIALLQSADITKDAASLKAAGHLLGVLQQTPAEWFQGNTGDDASWIETEIEKRIAAKAERDFATADAIRAALLAKGIMLEDSKSGTTWRKVS